MPLLANRRLWFFITAVCLFTITLFLLDRKFPLKLPNQKTLFAQVVVDQDGQPLRAFADEKGIWRYPTSLEEVSPLYIESLLTYEDRRFWWHPGIDPFALLRASFLNIRHGKFVSGGSTISMQVARLLHPHSRTFTGKLYQMVRTLQLEWHLSKKDILTLYCNIAPFGGTIEGVQAASYSYLSKPASDLTHAEAALLTVLPQAPTRFRPDLHPRRAEQARNKVLNRMVQLNTWPKTTVGAAKLEHVYASRVRMPMQAPLLARRLRQNNPNAVIKTTINRSMQTGVAEYVSQFMGTPFMTSQGRSTSAAVIIVNNPTAEVKAYVGTASFADIKRMGHIDMATTIRSPGSTLKPFVYGLALEQGLIHSHSLLSDTPKTFKGYRPANFNGLFSGPVSAAEALQRSLNVPAVDLLSRLSPKWLHDKLSHAGVELRLSNAKPNLSIILGGIGTNLENLVGAYSGLAKGGQVQQLKYTQNQIQLDSRYLLSPEAAWITYTMLKDVPTPDALQGVTSIVSRPSLAWKTGTSYGHRDTWAIGFDANYTVGVWVGRPDGTPMPGATGRDLAGRLLHGIAEQFEIGQADIPKPNTVHQIPICWPLGYTKAQTKPAHCHKELHAWTIHKTAPPTLPENALTTEPNPLTIWIRDKYWSAANCSGSTTTKRKSIALWPASMDPWLPRYWRRKSLLPKPDPSCPPVYGFGTDLSITSLDPETLVSVPYSLHTPPTLDLRTNSTLGEVHWYVNGQFFQSITADQTAYLALSKRGSNQIVVVDDFGRSAQSSVYWR